MIERLINGQTDRQTDRQKDKRQINWQKGKEDTTVNMSTSDTSKFTRHSTHFFISSIYITPYTNHDIFYKLFLKWKKMIYTVTFPLHRNIHFPSIQR